MGQRDEAMAVLLVRDGPMVHSKVVCIRRQVALLSHVSYHPWQVKSGVFLPCQVAHEPVVCTRSGGGAIGGGGTSATGPGRGGPDFLRRRLVNPPPRG